MLITVILKWGHYLISNESLMKPFVFVALFALDSCSNAHSFHRKLKMTSIVHFHAVMLVMWDLERCNPLACALKCLKAIPLLTIPQWEMAAPKCMKICRRIPLDWWSLLLGACFISLLFATNSKATSRCNFPVWVKFYKSNFSPWTEL